jgi:hypothetical protein
MRAFRQCVYVCMIILPGQNIAIADDGHSDATHTHCIYAYVCQCAHVYMQKTQNMKRIVCMYVSRCVCLYVCTNLPGQNIAIADDGHSDAFAH